MGCFFSLFSNGNICSGADATPSAQWCERHNAIIFFTRLAANNFMAFKIRSADDDLFHLEGKVLAANRKSISKFVVPMACDPDPSAGAEFWLETEKLMRRKSA